MKTPKHIQFQGLNFILSFGYSLILHALFGAVILSFFPVPSLSIDRPLADYMMVMLTDKTEVIKQPDKPKVRTKKPKPIAVKQAKPLPKEPEPPKSPPQEEPPPPPVEPEPPPPVVQEPEPVAPPAPEPEPVVPVQEPQAPPEPPVEPEPIVEAPLPEPEPVLPLEEPTTLPPIPEVAPAPPLLEPVVEELPAPEPPIVVSKTDEINQDQPEPEAHALLEEPAPEEPVFIPPVPPVVIVTEPYEGALLNATQGVTIRGTVDDPEIKTATVILNGAQVEVEVHEGRFETMLSNMTEENTLLVEATNAAGLIGQSALVRFLTRRPEPKDVQVILSCKASCADVRLTALKGEHPQSRGYLPFKPSAEIESSAIEYQNGSPYLAKLMAISKTDSGVYTVRLDPHSSQIASDCDPHLVVILYGYHPDRVRARVFRPSTASRGEPSSWILARFLMPQGFFWDEDDWTTGQIEDSRSITKFSSTHGIVWKELK